MRILNLQVICLPQTASEIVYEVITHGKAPATPKQIYSLIMKRLEAGVCVFVYILKAGGYRTAIGTLNTCLIPGNPTPKAFDTTNPTQTYWDFERNAFRDFTKANVVAIISL